MDYIARSLTFIAIYGISYGMVIFLISIGLVVTMGLMRVVNLAHGAFAALGGYLCTYLVTAQSLPFGVAVICATIGVSVFSLGLEKVVYTRIYKASELDQVLLTIGLMFVTVAGLNFFFGPNVQPSRLSPALEANIDILGRSVQVYRLFVVGVGATIVAGLWFLFEKTSFGARLRAAVDNRPMAQAIGIDVASLYSKAFVLGSGLAAFGGAVGYGMLPIEPLYPFKYLTIIMIVVALSGFGNMKSAAVVSILVGVVDTAGRYFFPTYGAFVIYGFLIAYLLLRIEGGFKRKNA
ncbi:branched-chain amino acid ABC transporter permease (plasmid) [Rhizobium bangladeshense]|uniref:branched-chain amino acid ABC transporter permease n=1 Tax=Rhizobium bangladeshense TaxID=1138189 RepID=UPI001A996DDB|nr:branched-chain amino acid ABC transporter permease [Rhizobium bangladeshense]QSY97893.1 branched-chain amino acid ABC transporter permease [Rhizobium bangladeshense]